MTATSTIPWLPTTSALEMEAPSLAEQVASMLHAERQVMILITGGDSGRVSGFLAELTHAVSHADSVLRIKAAIEVQELFILLAGQMNLPTQDLNPMQLATKVGDRLREKAPSGNFVLLCENAHQYSNTLLENIRQLSNYPINIVLSGRPKLLRRLWRPALFALKQRLNYRIDLNEWTFTGAFKWLVALSVIGAALFFGWRWIDASGLLKFAATPPAALSAPPASVHSPAVDAPRPIVAAPVVSEAPPASETPAAEPDPGLSLVMEPTLKRAPKQ